MKLIVIHLFGGKSVRHYNLWLIMGKSRVISKYPTTHNELIVFNSKRRERLGDVRTGKMEESRL